MVNIGNDWDEILKGEFDKEYYKKLRLFLIDEYRNYPVYPAMENIFNALKLSSYSQTKVVILGQDPYHEPGQAHGLCFSVNPGVEIPPSLKNIYKEITDEYRLFDNSMEKSVRERAGEDGFGIEGSESSCARFLTGDLRPWARQGVLLLNATLTVRGGQANSHKGRGWEIFTDRVIELLNNREKPIVFILWGRNAKEKIPLITNPDHLILTGAHPSPLSAYNGFFGGGYFVKANRFLETVGEDTIDWLAV